MSTLPKGLPKYDFSRMSGGGSDAAKALDVSALIKAKTAMLACMRGPKPGFFTLPERSEDLRATEKMARDISKKAKTLIVCGIGGSDLGARTLIHALAEPGKGMDVWFLKAGADPEELAMLLSSVDLKKCAINVVSKSGDTIEAMSNFLILRERLVKAVGKKRAAERIVATTDATHGSLREIARREGYALLPLPGDVGGRFSALTPVGLFPAICAGISGKRLLAGAAGVRDQFIAEAAERNDAMRFASLHHQAYRAGRRTTVLMTYSVRLSEFARWFRQLWAESLGKAHTRDGKRANHGFTPIAAIGPADQHSQLQLWNEGPDDTVVNFLAPERYRAEFTVPRAHKDLAPIALLGGKKLGAIMHAEIDATARTLMSHGRPSGTLTVPAITPESVGGLMMFFMLATAATAELLDVDAYDQPGVQEDKELLRKALGRL